MQITIPCSKLSRAMLLSKQHGEPVQLSEYDYEFFLIKFGLLNKIKEVICELEDRELNYLDATITIKIVSNSDINNVDVATLGLNLHYYHYSKLNQILEDQFGLVESIPFILQNIYARYNLDEDILSTETLVKRFYRFRKKNTLKLDTDFKASVLRKGAKSKFIVSAKTDNNKHKVRLHSTHVNEQIKQAIELYPSLAKDRLGRLIPVRVKALKCYIYNKKSNQPMRKKLEILNCKRSTFYFHVKQVQKRLDELGIIL